MLFSASVILMPAVAFSVCVIGTDGIAAAFLGIRRYGPDN